MVRDFAASWLQNLLPKELKKLAWMQTETSNTKFIYIKIKKLDWKNTETSSDESLIFVVFPFLWKKKILRNRNLTLKCKKACVNLHRTQLLWNSYDFRPLVPMKEKTPMGRNLSKRRQTSVWPLSHHFF